VAQAIAPDVDTHRDPRRALRADSVRFIGTVGTAVGIQAPTGGVTFLPALMAGIVGALAVVAALSLIAFLPFTVVTPLDAYVDLATYGADLIIVVYLLTVIAAFVWSPRRRRNPVQLLTLLAGVVVVGYVLKGTVYPIPPHPFDYCIDAAGITLVAGAGLLALSPALRRSLRAAPLFAVDAH